MAFVPVVFDQADEDGKVLLNTSAPDPELAEVVRAAAERCPSGAITLHGDKTGANGSESE